MEGYVAKALEHANGEVGVEDIHDALLAEQMFLFVAQRPRIIGAATCEVVQYVRKIAIRVITLGGEDFSDWGEPLLRELNNWAGRIGASGIEAYVRKGFVPQLTELGFSEIYHGVWYEHKKG